MCDWLTPSFTPAERRAGMLLNDLLIALGIGMIGWLALWSSPPVGLS